MSYLLLKLLTSDMLTKINDYFKKSNLPEGVSSLVFQNYITFWNNGDPDNLLPEELKIPYHNEHMIPLDSDHIETNAEGLMTSIKIKGEFMVIDDLPILSLQKSSGYTTGSTDPRDYEKPCVVRHMYEDEEVAFIDSIHETE